MEKQSTVSQRRAAMWNGYSNNDANIIYAQLELKSEFPVRCPACKGESAHLYMHVHNVKTRRGGLWIWCSECHAFAHGSVYVPNDWGNCPEVEADKLCAIPEYLEEIKEVIDKHVNELMRRD